MVAFYINIKRVTTLARGLVAAAAVHRRAANASAQRTNQRTPATGFPREEID